MKHNNINDKKWIANKEMRKKNIKYQQKIKIIVVLGEGGHTKQLMTLIDLLGKYYKYHYVVVKEDKLSIKKISYFESIHQIRRPRGKKAKVVRDIIYTINAGIISFYLLVKIRPKAIISNGPAIAVPISIVGKILRIKVIFIESASRVFSLSLTGRILYHFSDLFFVQWPQLKKKFPRAIFAGRLV